MFLASNTLSTSMITKWQLIHKNAASDVGEENARKKRNLAGNILLLCTSAIMTIFPGLDHKTLWVLYVVGTTVLFC